MPAPCVQGAMRAAFAEQNQWNAMLAQSYVCEVLSSLSYGVGLSISFRTSAMLVAIESQLRNRAHISVCEVIQRQYVPDF